MDRSVTASGKQLAKIELDRAFAAARRYARKSRAKNIWRAYRSDWQQFEAWCQTVGLQPLPADPETIAIFVANQGVRWAQSIDPYSTACCNSFGPLGCRACIAT